MSGVLFNILQGKGSPHNKELPCPVMVGRIKMVE